MCLVMFVNLDVLKRVVLKTVNYFNMKTSTTSFMVYGETGVLHEIFTVIESHFIETECPTQTYVYHTAFTRNVA